MSVWALFSSVHQDGAAPSAHVIDRGGSVFQRWRCARHGINGQRRRNDFEGLLWHGCYRGRSADVGKHGSMKPEGRRHNNTGLEIGGRGVESSQRRHHETQNPATRFSSTHDERSGSADPPRDGRHQADLEAWGASFKDVVHIFVLRARPRMGGIGKASAVINSYFAPFNQKPTSTNVAVLELGEPEQLIEIQVVAVVD